MRSCMYIRLARACMGSLRYTCVQKCVWLACRGAHVCTCVHMYMYVSHACRADSYTHACMYVYTRGACVYGLTDMCMHKGCGAHSVFANIKKKTRNPLGGGTFDHEFSGPVVSFARNRFCCSRKAKSCFSPKTGS